MFFLFVHLNYRLAEAIHLRKYETKCYSPHFLVQYEMKCNYLPEVSESGVKDWHAGLDSWFPNSKHIFSTLSYLSRYCIVKDRRKGDGLLYMF